MIKQFRLTLHRKLFNIWRITPVVLLLVFTAGSLQAQTPERDTTSTAIILNADSVILVAPESKPHSSIKATMYALVLPGLGQAYNKKYYKIPIVYIAFGVAGYTVYNNKNYYQEALDYYAANPTDTRAESYARQWRKYLDMSYMAIVAIYGLQVIDAYVDAELFNWDVSRDLSLRVQPSVNPIMAPGIANSGSFGLTCSFTFK